jgi:hypothetical protein
MLAVLTVIIMAAVGYAYLVEGLFTAFVMFCNVIVAGLIAFNFWEPVANLLDPALKGYEDALCLVIIFSLALGALRTITNNLARTEVEFPAVLQRGGGALFGLATGYLVSGFLVCVMQTLPMHQEFMGFEAKYVSDPGVRRFLPPDLVWLAMMNRAGTASLAGAGPTFDELGSFELRYARYRRYSDDDKYPMTHQGEFDSPPLTAPSAPGP